jgi:hypothetical protein
MKVERSDPGTDSDSVCACYEIYLSGMHVDDPLGPPMSPRAFAGWLTLGWTEDPQETWLARDDSGRPWPGTPSACRSARTVSWPR